MRSRSARVAPLVLVGGAFQTKESWGRLEREMLGFADVITVDLPGWGASPVLPEHYGTDFLADALGHMLDDLGLPSVNLVGGSYGSAVAYRLAQRRPGLAAKMVLVGTMTHIPDQARARMCRSVDLLTAGQTEEFTDVTLGLLMNVDTVASVVAGARVRRFLLRRLLNLTPHDKEQFIANTRRLLRHEGLDLNEPPMMPVLVAAGEHDSFTTPGQCRALAATCADSWFAVVSDADHMLPVERPVELVDLFMRFLCGEPLEALEYLRTAERISPLVAV
ncbi:alpha/beta hydrolase [Streptomyces sp. RY43-2]|uniref:Alpha/beta hydrolase n=1 Tax=Streptomyces macrolidinus TaxID=2952607 RepID=A0ABT0ZJA4_9ACTN|nr:alpha/beta hydrolase [Streptomyces macrolidinus]MCN9243673.1 alpha/beta hydrolase [Streptomyces macrolidinus]